MPEPLEEIAEAVSRAFTSPEATEWIRQAIKLAKAYGKKEIADKLAGALMFVRDKQKLRDFLEKNVPDIYKYVKGKLPERWLEILARTEIKIYGGNVIVLRIEGEKVGLTFQYKFGKLYKELYGEKRKIPVSDYLRMMAVVFAENPKKLENKPTLDEMFAFYDSVVNKVLDMMSRGEVIPFSDPEMEDIFYSFIERLKEAQEDFIAIDWAKNYERMIDYPDGYVYYDEYNAYIPSSIIERFRKLWGKKFSEAIRLTGLLKDLGRIRVGSKRFRVWILDRKKLEKYGVQFENKGAEKVSEMYDKILEERLIYDASKENNEEESETEKVKVEFDEDNFTATE